jgi:hypothetical protein
MAEQFDIPIRSDDGYLKLIRAYGGRDETAGLHLIIFDRDGEQRGDAILMPPEMQSLRNVLDDFLNR